MPAPSPLSGFAAAGPAVVHVFQHLQCLQDDAVARLALDVAKEADAAGVVLLLGIVQALCGRIASHNAILLG